MADLAQVESAFLKADQAGDTQAATVLAGEVRRLRADAASPAESAAMQSGRKLNSSVQGGINALQGPMFGFADEIYGGLSAAGRSIAGLFGDGNGQSFKQNYEDGRDTVRGATDEFRKQYPGTAMGTSLAASAPTMVLGGAGPVNAVAQSTRLARALTAGKVGAAYGAANAAGESTAGDLAGVAGDTAKGAVLSGMLGTGGQGVAAGMGAGGSAVMQRLSEASATDAARRRLAEFLSRDARGIGASNPTAQVEARLSTLGPEATIADAAGQNSRQALDTLASMPGTAKDATEKLIHGRQAARSGRLVDAADEALGTQSRGYTATLEALDTAKKTQAKPLYDQLDGLSVKVDDDLGKLLQSAEKAHGGAETLAKVRGELPIDLSVVKAGDDVPFQALDKVKQSLYDLAQSAKQSGNRTLGAAYDDLRIRLTNKMDGLSPKDANGSIYQQARNAYSGPAQLSDAVEAGRSAMKTDAIGVSELTKGMAASEREAFRIGALQSIRDKVGTEAGQTSLLKMWKEPATSGKLKEIFGGDYRAFAAEVAKEARLKLLESTGRGSQTAARMFGAGELDSTAAAANAASGVMAGMAHPAAAVPGVISGMARAWNQVKTPEATRNELARMLLLKGPQAQQELQGLPQFMRDLNAQQQRNAALAGALSGQTQK